MPSTLQTRYDFYNWELEPGGGATEVGSIEDPDETGSTALSPSYPNLPARSGSSENPAPSCNARLGAPSAGSPDRRMIYIAVADCTGISGNATPDLQSARYGKFFLVRPSSSGEIIAEFIEWIEPNDDSGILRNIVQLYR
jgi:hypothetical protein